MAIPFLLDPVRCRSAERLTDKIVARTGELAAYLAANPDTGLDPVLSSARENSALVSGISRDVLLLDLDGRAMLLDRHPIIRDARPFGHDGPTAGEISGQRVAMALYPLAGRGGHDSSIGLVAALEEEDRPYHILLPGMSAEGDSWTLAAGLCRHFCCDGSQEDRISLASNWIVTGKLTGSTVAHVDLGNKTDYYPKIPNRIWLVPASSYRHPNLIKYQRLSYRVAHDLDTAIAHIIGRGSTRCAPLTSWPDCHEFHTFVSDTKEPILMAAYFSADVPFNLWCSSADYFPQARLIQGIIETKLNKHCLLPDNPEDLVSSEDIALAERVLSKHLEPTLALNRRILFNITQGNTIMRYAAFLLARRFPDLWLIYRNFDFKADPVFDLIRFPGSEALTQRIDMQRTGSLANWDALFADNRKLEKTPEAWADYYFPGTIQAASLP